MFITVFRILCGFLFTCVQTWFFHKTITPNPAWKRTHLFMIILIFSLLQGFLQLYLPSVLPLAGILVIVSYILYPVFFMGGKLKEKILWGIINITLLYLSSILRYSLLYPFKSKSPAPSYTFTAVSFLLQFIIYAGTVWLIAHSKIEGQRYIPVMYWTALNICFSAILVAIVVFDFFSTIGNLHSQQSYITVVTLVLFAFWILLYFVFYFVCRYFSKIVEANALTIQNDLIERYLLRKQATDERIKMLSHDLKHSLIQWRTLAQDKGDSKALQSILEYEKQLSSSLLINVENENANAIINQKFWEAGQHDIDFEVEGAFHKDLLISSLDLCSLLGNLLDNALEAASQVKTQHLRSIKLKLSRRNNFLLVFVENGYAVPPIMKDGLFLSSKKDNGLHAIGTQSIQYIAEKYSGVVNHSLDENWFKSTVMLKGYQENQTDQNRIILYDEQVIQA